MPVNRFIISEWRDPSSRARICAWLKVLVCLIGYGVVLEVVSSYEASLGHSLACAIMGVFTAAMLILALVYLAIFRRARRLAVAGSIAYFAVCAATFCLEGANPVAALRMLLIGTFVMLFAALVAVFNPFRGKRNVDDRNLIYEVDGQTNSMGR